MKHCGKSTIGRMLSERLGLPFSDLDDLAESFFFTETGERLSSREIFRKGRDVFQKYEYKASLGAVDSAKHGRIICAAGGGICENKRALDAVASAFITVYIAEEAEVLYSRIIRGGIPAFLSSSDPFEDFKRLFKTRTAIYDKIADIKVVSAGRTAEEIFEETAVLLEEANAG